MSESFLKKVVGLQVPAQEFSREIFKRAPLDGCFYDSYSPRVLVSCSYDEIREILSNTEVLLMKKLCMI